MALTYKVLIADDEERSRRLIRMNLERDSALVDETDNGENALNLALENNYDIIVLDCNIPGLDGLEVCYHLKSLKSIPVLMLSAKGEAADRIRGFEVGADDYMVKPFSLRELVCRIHAILKRSIPEKFGYSKCTISSDVIHPNLIIQHSEQRVIVDGYAIDFTLKEYQLFRYFALNEGKTFTREMLLKDVWQYELSGDPRRIDSYIKRIREKIHRTSPLAAARIRTIWGVGYRFEAAAPTS